MTDVNIYRRVLGSPLSDFVVSSGLEHAPEFAIPVAATIGSELITSQTDRDFSIDAGNWSGVDWVAGAGVYTHTAGANAATLGAYAPTIGKIYQVVITITTTTTDTITITYGGASVSAVGQDLGTLTALSLVLTATTADFLTLTPGAAWEGSVDDVSIKEVVKATPSVIINDSLGNQCISIKPGNSTTFGIGRGCISRNVNGTNLIAVGINSLMNCDDSENFALGINCLLDLRKGTGNFALGFNSGKSLLYGDNNFFLGSDAAPDLVNGSRNHISGWHAALALISGSSNYIDGLEAAKSLVSGSNNHIMGWLTAGALLAGSNNHIVGVSAGRNLTSANDVVFLGASCGSVIVSGANCTSCSSSILIGDTARPLNNGDTNEIAIGYRVYGNGSNTVTLGNTSVTDTYLQGSVHNDSLSTQVLVEVIQDLSVSTTMTFNIPENAIILGVKFRNDTILTSGDGATNFQADLSGGSTETIVDTQALAQNTKPVWSGHVKCFATTQMIISSATGTLNGGTVRATIKYTPPMDAYADV